MIKVKGESTVRKVSANLRKTARGIQRTTVNTTEHGVNLAFQFVLNLAPEYTGALKAAILKFRDSRETWSIISLPPQGDGDYPTNILFDEGVYPNPRRQNSLRFMQKTIKFINETLPRNMRKRISATVESKGSVN